MEGTGDGVAKNDYEHKVNNTSEPGQPTYPSMDSDIDDIVT